MRSNKAHTRREPPFLFGSFSGEYMVPKGEEMAPEGAKSGPPEEESLASLLIKEARRLNQQDQEFSPDHNRQPGENKEYDPKGEGVSTAN